jgi:hypothetical protein
MILSSAYENPVITAELKDEVNLTNLNFLSDEQLKDRLASTNASEAQLDEALAINAAARTRALKMGFAIMSGVALLAIFPCSWLPAYRPGEIRNDQPPRK